MKSDWPFRMASTKTLQDKKQMKEMLECPVCFGRFKDARTLPCQHPLCLICVTTLTEKTSKDGKISCPTCRQECEVPKEGVKKFPKHFFINQLDDLVPDSVPCANTEAQNPHDEPKYYCEECRDHLCEQCRKSHLSLRVLRNHSIIDIAHISPRETPKSRVQALREEAKMKKPKTIESTPPCELHDGYPLKYYCLPCKEPVCSDCVVAAHEGHPRKPIKDVAEEKKRKLSEIAARAGKYASQMEETAEKLDVQQSDIDRDVDEVKRRIDSTIDEAISELEKKRHSLHKEVAAAAHEVQNIKESTENFRKCAQEIADRATSLHRTDDPIHICQETDLLEDELRVQEGKQIPSLSWKAENVVTDVTVQGVIDSIARVSLETSYVTGISESEEESDIKLGAAVETIDLIYDGKKVTEGIGIIYDGILCVAHGSDPHIWLYHQGSLLKKVTIRSKDGTAADTAGMVVLDAAVGELVITDLNRKLHFITLTPALDISSHNIQNLQYVPYSVTLASDGHILVLNHTDKQIRILNKNGDEKRCVQIQKTENTDILRAVRLGQGFLITDTGDQSGTHYG